MHKAELLCEIYRPWDASRVQFAADLSRAMVRHSTRPHVTVIDLPGGQERCIQEEDGITDADLSADGRQVATGSGRFACIWDAATGERQKLFAHSFPSDSPGVDGVIVSPDGRRLVSHYDTWRVWDTATGTVLCDLPPKGRYPGPRITADRRIFSPDGRWFVGRAREAAGLGIWDAATGELVRVLADVRGRVLAYDGRTLATGSARTFAAWDAATGRPLLKFRAGNSSRASAEFSPDGHQLAAGIGGDAVVWDVASGELIHRLPIALDVAFSPSGRWLATLGYDALEFGAIWDLAAQRVIWHVPGRFIVQVLFGAEDHLLATQTLRPVSGTLRLWRLADAPD
jgi:WD40 repeat protein